MKKIISFLIFLLIINTGLCAYCEELSPEDTSNIADVDVKPSIFTPKTEREIKAHILNIYGEACRVDFSLPTNFGRLKSNLF